MRIREPVRRAGFQVDPAAGFRHDWFPAQGTAGTVVDQYRVVRAARCRIAVEAVLPDAGVELYFNLGPSGRHLVRERITRRAPSPRAAWVVGPHAHRLLVAKEIRDCDVVSVRLHPGAAGRLFGVPASTLCDDLVDLELLWGRGEVERIRERLAAEPGPARRMAVLELALLHRLAAEPVPAEWHQVRALCTMLDGSRPSTIAEFAARTGLAHRRLIAACVHHVGLTPKGCQRLMRLRRVLESAADSRHLGWARIASACGYYDQAHLINEFRALTGLTPAEYLARRSSAGIGFVPVLRIAQDSR